MLDRLAHRAMSSIPIAGSPMQVIEHLFLFSLFQPSAQCLRKERMVAIPPPLSIQRYQKNIRSLQRLQDLLAACLSHDGLAQ